MCVAVALSCSELPLALVAEADLGRRVHRCGGDHEVRFYWRARPAVLPVWWEGQLHVVRWGNRDRHDPRLPPTGWTWRATVEQGRWAWAGAEPVDVPATAGWMGGVWYQVKHGVRGLLVRDGKGEPVVFLICERATNFYRNMTRADWMPVLIEQVI